MAVMTAAVITLSSCDWLFPGKETQFTIAGKWKIDSADYSKTKDSPAVFVLLAAISDSALKRTIYEFNDSGQCISHFNDSLREVNHFNLDLKDQVLILGEDSSAKEFRLKDITKAGFTIISNDKDSTSYHFKRYE